MIIHTYGGVPMVPPAKSIQEADDRWRAALAAGDSRSLVFQQERARKAKAFSHALVRSRGP